jgi:hypothetical protein
MPRSEAIPGLEEAKAAAKAAENQLQWDAARRAIARALELAPEDPELHQRMSWLASNSTELEDAERARLTAKHWEMAVKLKSRVGQGPRDRQPEPAVRSQRLGTPLAVPTSPQRRKTPAAGMVEFGDEEDAAPVPARKRSKVSLPFRVLLGVGLLVGLVWGIASAVTGPQGEDPELKQQLGTRLTVFESRKSSKMLAIEVQKSWLSLREDEQAKEVALIRDAAKKLGYEEVHVYSGGGLVGHAAGEIVCTHPSCLSRVPAI